jgi:hypothetical protein
MGAGMSAQCENGAPERLQSPFGNSGCAADIAGQASHPDESFTFRSPIMSNASQKPTDGSQSADAQSEDGDETFTTDVSESDEEGTTVREAEVRKDDLSEVKPDEKK